MSISEGTLIRATHRPQDLIPAFKEFLRESYPGFAEAEAVAPFPRPPSYAMEDPDSEWWTSEDAFWYLEELFDLLNELAPADMYFGAHEGDGSDFGFWKITEEWV